MTSAPAPLDILWFAPVPPVAVCERYGIDRAFGGWWIDSLQKVIQVDSRIRLSIAWASRDIQKIQCFTQNNVRYYVFPDVGWLGSRRGRWRKLCDQGEFLFSAMPGLNVVSEAEKVISMAQPDLVHIYGSEHSLGLLASRTRLPLAVWIQGILDVYQHYYFGSLSWRARCFAPQIFWNYYKFRKSAKRERLIFVNGRYFIGRTGWDRAQQQRLQPSGEYYRVQDCVRHEFLGCDAWTSGAAGKCVIYTTSSEALLKGTDLIVEAIGLLRQTFPGLRLRIAGKFSSSGIVTKNLRRAISAHGLDTQVEFLGQLSAPEIIQELGQARLYVLSSYIENNPNSLFEAQLVGVPCVAALVGGVGDLIEADRTGLLFKAGDAVALAAQIRRLLESDELATKVGRDARQIARARHDPSRIAAALYEAYVGISGNSNQREI